ncbi:hypothetical protein C0J52_18814 [Blattella germanica]|nr:hypothetical protein C0J52_18814 [Blattella germanica]
MVSIVPQQGDGLDDLEMMVSQQDVQTGDDESLHREKMKSWRASHFPGSSRTAVRRLNNHGIRSRRALIKEPLSDEQSVNRVAIVSSWEDVDWRKALIDEYADKNVIVSPLSLRIALGLMYLGARGSTAKQMAAGLYIPENENAVKMGFRHVMNSIRSTKDIDLEIANKLYVQSSFNISKDFRRAARKAFGTDARELNFQRNPEKARKVINSWVEKRTNQKITQIIEPGILTLDTRMVLVNAVYLKGEWLTPFYDGDTQIAKFHINAQEEVDVSMMELKTEFGYKHLEEHGLQVLELPYKGETASMFVLLPDVVDGILNLEEKIHDFDLSAIFNNLNMEEVLVKFPKFKVSASMDLEGTLEKVRNNLIVYMSYCLLRQVKLGLVY